MKVLRLEKSSFTLLRSSLCGCREEGEKDEMWLENKQEPYHGRFYKCSKDTLKISVACCNVMVQFVLCTQAPAKEVDGGGIQIHI